MSQYDSDSDAGPVFTLPPLIMPKKPVIDLSKVSPFPDEIPRELIRPISYEEWIPFLKQYDISDYEINTRPSRQQIQIGVHDTRTMNKIHMMFRHEYFPFVVDRIMSHRRLFFNSNIKLMARPLTTAVDKEWDTFPASIKLETDLPQAEINVRPDVISSLSLRDEFGKSTFMSNGREYKYETVFLPKIVFYPDKNVEIKDLISLLLTLFPEERIGAMIEPNYYPRFNLRLNSVLFIAMGDADFKNGTVNKLEDHYEVIPNYSYHKPSEYDELEKTCSSKVTKQECLNQNQLSKRISNQNVCDWEDTCVPTKQFSSNLIMDFRYPSLEQFYHAIGHSELLGKKTKKTKTTKTTKTKQKRNKVQRNKKKVFIK